MNCQQWMSTDPPASALPYQRIATNLGSVEGFVLELITLVPAKKPVFRDTIKIVVENIVWVGLRPLLLVRAQDVTEG